MTLPTEPNICKVHVVKASISRFHKRTLIIFIWQKRATTSSFSFFHCVFFRSPENWSERPLKITCSTRCASKSNTLCCKNMPHKEHKLKVSQSVKQFPYIWDSSFASLFTMFWYMLDWKHIGIGTGHIFLLSSIIPQFRLSKTNFSWMTH